MARRWDARLVGFDADDACEYLLETYGSHLRSVAEFTPEGYTLLYLSEDLIEEYGGIEAIESAGDSVHEYLNLDFRERELFLDLYPTMDDVDGFLTVAEDRAIARVLTPDDEGLYFSTTLDVPVVEPFRDVASMLDSE